MIEVLLNFGPYRRIWPNIDGKGTIFVSVSTTRSFVEPMCKIFRSEDSGNSWIELVDQYQLDRRNSTTGQPFISKEGTVLIPVWDYGFYQFGRTGLTIFQSNDSGLNWKKVYSNPKGCYGNHIFQDEKNGNLFLTAGIGGGGYKGRVRYAPANGLLLKSEDLGDSWNPCLEVEGPTALYDGVAYDDTIVVSARERKSILRSEDNGRTWNEIFFGKHARNICKINSNIVLCSDSAIFISYNEGLKWTERISPLKNLVFRYPIIFQDKLLMSGVGWRSLILGTSLKKENWFVMFDISKFVKSNFMTRLALSREYLFIGDEGSIGQLIRIPLKFLKPQNTSLYSKYTSNSWRFE